jgi:hypothetical protein
MINNSNWYLVKATSNEMNVVITPTEYKSGQVYFTEKRVNTHIANSIFNRITYSTNDFIMNGIYIQFELFVKHNEQTFNSNIYNCHFDPQHEHNRAMLTIFQNIETTLLDKWIQIQHQSPVDTATATATALIPTPSNDIIQQLRTGVISVWKHEMSIHDKPQFQHFIIKISGVWENDAGCGLTYKFF